MGLIEDLSLIGGKIETIHTSSDIKVNFSTFEQEGINLYRLHIYKPNVPSIVQVYETASEAASFLDDIINDI